MFDTLRYKFLNSKTKIQGYLSCTERTKVLIDYMTVVIGATLTRVVSFLTSVILARQLGPEGFGRFSVFFALLVAFWTSTNFIDSTYVRYSTIEKHQSKRSYLRNSFAVKLFSCLLLIISAYPVAKLLSKYVFAKPELELEILISIFSGAALSLVSLRAAIYQANENFTYFTFLNFIFYFMTFVILLILFFGEIDLNIKAVYGVYFVSALTIAAVSFIGIYKLSKPILIEKFILYEILSFSKWLIAANLTYIIFQRLDLLILARYGKMNDLGQYGVALRLTVIASLLTGSISAPLLPRATRTRDSIISLKSYFKHAFLISGLISLVIGILWFFIPIIVKIFFGEAYTPAIYLAKILLLGSIFVAIYTPLSQLFLAEDNPKKMFFLGLIKLSGILGVGLLLIPHYGAIGAAYTVAFSELITMLYVFVILRTSKNKIGKR